MAWRTMRRNEQCETPSQVISLGWSAKQEGPSDEMEIHSLYAIANRRRAGQWTAREHWQGSNPVYLWDWIRGRLAARQPAWIFTVGWHQASILSGLWAEFEADRFRLGIPARPYVDADGQAQIRKAWAGFFCVESRPFVVFGVSTRGTVKVVDVRNYLDLSEQEVCEAADSDHTVENPWDRDDTAHRWHAEAMAESTHRVMTRLIDHWSKHDRGNWQPTAGRLALSNWRHSFMPDHAIQYDSDSLNRSHHRMGLYGGEVRAFRKGRIDGPIYHVDCRSLYANVMRQGVFPWKVTRSHECGSILGQTQPDYPDRCIATVAVWAGGNTPVRDSRGRVTYPTGHVITTLAGQELAAVVQADMVESWYAWDEFALAPLFQHYAEYWLAIREQAKTMGDKVGERLAKMMNNSLSGKFAGRSALWQMDTRFPAVRRWGNWIAPQPDTGRWTQYRAIAGVTQRMTERAEKDDTFPAITAFITASGREYMRAVRSTLPDNSVICQQTDGWLLTAEGYDVLRSSLYWNENVAGCFRLISEHEYVEVIGPNHYRGDGLNCMAGLPAGSEELADLHWRVRLPESTADFVRRGGGTPKVKIKEGDFWIGRDGGGEEFGVGGVAYS